MHNNSTVVSTHELAGSLAIFECQANRHFNRYWSNKPRVELSLRASLTSPRSVWNAYIYDDLAHVPSNLVRDEALAGAVGWHELDGGVPFLVVLAATCKSSSRAFNSWTWGFSHELLETLANPWDQYVGPYPGFGGVKAVAYGAEICDPVEGTGYLYKGRGPVLCNFVTPAWFDPAANSGPVQALDYLKTLKVPLVAGPNGSNNLVVLY